MAEIVRSGVQISAGPFIFKMTLDHILRTAFFAAGNVSKCVPDERLRRISDIDSSSLYERGIRHLLIDWDGTIVPYHSYAIGHDSESALRRMGEFFSVSVLSNCTPDAKSFMEYAIKEKGLPIRVFRAVPKKPSAEAYYAAMFYLGIENPSEVACIGDRILTDVLGAKSAGLYTILVEGYPENDPWKIRLAKAVENLPYVMGKAIKAG